jgi:peptide/nickel transport system substrate-binding protein
MGFSSGLRRGATRVSGAAARRRWLALAVVGLLIGLGLAACSGKAFKADAAKVSQIIEAQLGDPNTFNYALNNSSPNVFGNLYEGLISENALTSQVEPALAEKWEQPDKQRLIFTLRENLKWSDGQPLTVDDVVFSYQDIYLNPEVPTDIQDVLRIGKDRKLPTVRKLDGRRVEFTIPEPFAPFLRSLGLAILPKHSLEAAVKNTEKGQSKFLSTWGTNTDPRKIVCNGPYRLESYVTSQRVVFGRNPYYWRRDAAGQQLPYIDRVVWKLVENRDVSMMQFRSGGSDVLEPIRPEDFPLLKKEERRGKFTLYAGGPRQATPFITFNLNQGKRNGKPLVDPIKSKWFNNLAFRQAVAYGIDREKINTNLYRGLGFLVNSPLIPQSPYFLAPEQGLKTYGHDPAKAKQILKAAGFKYDAQGQLEDADGHPVKFTLLTNAENTLRVNIIAQIKQDLARIGMSVALNPVQFNVLGNKVSNDLDWESVMMLYGGGLEPHGGSNMWSTTGASHIFNQKPTGQSRPIQGQMTAPWEKDIENLYIQGAQELNEAKRQAIYAKTQQISQENLPFIYLVTERIMAVVRDRVQGVQYPEGGEALWNLQNLRVVD